MKTPPLKTHASSSALPQAWGWGLLGKRSVKASYSLSSLWTPPLQGDISLEASKFSHTLQMASTYGKQNVTLAAALTAADKVGGDAGLLLWFGRVKCVFNYRMKPSYCVDCKSLRSQQA